MKKGIVLFFSIFLVIPAITLAQHHGSFQKYWYVQESDTLPYRLLLPAKYNPRKKYPLILFLHGAGERGNNNESQLNNGGLLFVRDSIMLHYPAIVVFPQCAKHSSWANSNSQKDTVTKIRTYTFPKISEPKKDMKLVMELLAELSKDYSVDTTRLYVGGLSMGGFGTYDLVNRMPEKFAAAFVICGAGDTSNAKNMTRPSWWLFHGEKDSTVFPQNSRMMEEALKKAGADVKLTIYPEDGHASWNDAFKEPGLFEWMFKKKLTN